MLSFCLMDIALLSITTNGVFILFGKYVWLMVPSGFNLVMKSKVGNQTSVKSDSTSVVNFRSGLMSSMAGRDILAFLFSPDSSRILSILSSWGLCLNLFSVLQYLMPILRIVPSIISIGLEQSKFVISFKEYSY